ncbi:Ubiquitin-like domain-containing CTD phosphatase 1 [Halotydeus destructor]|nr:Ubiquitin-like domain-containing CTD phosphatase 1 [Halotydeus destructor]
MNGDSDFTLIVKWNGQEFDIDNELISLDSSVLELKNAVFKKTGVMPERQKLLGLKLNGKPAPDTASIGELKLRNKTKLMLMGSKEEDIAGVSRAPENIPEVVNDLDVPDELEIPIANRGEYLAKIEKRVRDYQIKILNEPRPGKKLLVLDIDYTLFDHRSVAENANQLMRPFLHEFLTDAYQDYDIAIWSATSMKWIEVKMRELGVSTNPNYKIVFFLDSSAMISVHAPNYGLLDVKPLGVIWGKFDHYTPQNTIMFDDIRRNFLMNPQNGLRIKAFREAHKNRETDRELIKLAQYLKIIAQMDDISTLNHSKWHRVLDR